MGVAKVVLIGNLGRDPETRYTPSGTMNVQFSMAVSRKWNDQSGQQQERTTWYRVTGWGKLAETLDSLTQNGALVKGKQVYVMGTLEPREYQDQAGVTKTSLDVRADELQLLGSRGEFDGGPPSGGRPQSRPDETGSYADNLDDVPF